MKNVLIPLGLSIAATTVAANDVGASEERPFAFYEELMEGDDTFTEIYCLEQSAGLVSLASFGRAKTVGLVSLTIVNVTYDSGDVEHLEIGYSGFSGRDTNATLMTQFVSHVENAFEPYGRAVDVSIGESVGKVRAECFRNNMDDGAKAFQRATGHCEGKATTFARAMFGPDILQLHCNMKVKGREYPIITSTNCSVTSSADFKYNAQYAATFLDVIEESNPVKGVSSLLKVYAGRMATILDVAKMCK